MNDIAKPASRPGVPAPRAAVLGISPYIGGESKIPGVNRIIKLSSNEGAFGPPKSAQEAYLRVAAEIHRYPDGGSAELRRAIGARFGLDPERIVCGTGSDELIAHLCHIYTGPGSDILMSMHGFSMYQISGTYAGARVIKVPERNITTDVDAMLAAVTPQTRIVFIANPNNPTGSLLPQSEVERLRAGLPPEVLLVLDAAYAEYVVDPAYEAGTTLVEQFENVVMTRTFSKMFGLGGLRLGWIYAPAHILDLLNRVRGPFNVSVPAQAAGVAALAEPGWVERSIAHNTAERERVTTALTASGISVGHSDTNFVLADFSTPEKAIAADLALQARGVIVRRVGGYGLPQCLRITIGLAGENDLVIAALTDFMQRNHE